MTTRQGSRKAVADNLSPATTSSASGGVRRRWPCQSNSPVPPTTIATPSQQHSTAARSADVCPLCTVQITNNDTRIIKCDICMKCYHQKCTLIPAKTFDKLIAIVNITGWICNSCKETARSIVQKTQSAIAVLTEQVAEMKQSISELQISRRTTNVDSFRNDNSAHSTNTTNDAQTQSKQRRLETANIVHRTLADIDKRRRNVIVTGLPEMSNDRQAFIDICETHLTVKPAITDKDCIRLGEKRNDRPRLLLVRLRSETTAAEILRVAPLLRRCSDHSIAGHCYINPDLSPEAARAAFERRQRRRAAEQEAGRRQNDNGGDVNRADAPAAAAATDGEDATNRRPSQLE